MTDQPLAVLSTGMVSSVGLGAPAACAAIRSGLTNPVQTAFMDSEGEFIMGHAVPLEEEWRGREKLARMAAMIVEQCVVDVPRADWQRIPVLLCVAEGTRPGRLDRLDEDLFSEICELLDHARFDSSSIVIPHGRVSIAVAVSRARRLLYEANAFAVLIVAADSLLSWPTLKNFSEQGRLLSAVNSNGFIPGEGAAGLLLSRPDDSAQLIVEGVGFAVEAATIETDEPLRAEGLSRAINDSLADAGRELHELDFRIADISGEQYYFKEAALALSRTLRRRKEQFDIWHPAESIGEVGAAIGPTMLAVAHASAVKGYAPGPKMLVHASNDAGQRAAIVVRSTVS